MNTPTYYLVETPEVTLTFIGTVQQDPLAPGMVWLCTPDGRPLLQCHEEYVSESSRQKTAQRIMADIRTNRRHANRARSELTEPRKPTSSSSVSAAAGGISRNDPPAPESGSPS